MSVHVLTPKRINDPVTQAKIDLAAAHRLSVKHGFDEGIDNHYTVNVPGRDDRWLILPFGLHWSEACASHMIEFDEQGRTTEGEGDVELSAQCIHVPVHKVAGAPVVLHTHQPWALALNMLQDNRLIPSSQTAAFFHGHVAYDDTYTGTADFMSEGERLAHLMGSEHHVVFMKNHGVMVVGDTIAQAYRRLYLLERVCQAQVLAMSTGQPLAPLSDDIIAKVQEPTTDDRHSRAERERLFFEAMKRILDREMPGYAN